MTIYPSSSQSISEEVFRAEAVKQLAVGTRIAPENISIRSMVDAAGCLVAQARFILAAHKMESRSEKTRTEQTFIPATLIDWLKFYLRRALHRPSYRGVLMRLRLRITVNYVATQVTEVINEEWSLCPHTVADPKEHWRFIQFGGDFKSLNDEAGRLANEILNAALEDEAPGDFMRPNIRLLSAVHRYKKLLNQ